MQLTHLRPIAIGYINANFRKEVITQDHYGMRNSSVFSELPSLIEPGLPHPGHSKHVPWTGIMDHMVIHSIPEIGSVLRNAVMFNFKNPAEAIMNADSLLAQVQQLFNLLDERKTDYVLVGGIALLTYVEGRNTQDIDLIMALPSLAKIPEIRISSQDMYFVRGLFGELQIDILLTENPLFNRVADKYSTKKKFLDRDIRCATVEGLILLKLFALPSLYRQGSFERVGIYENDLGSLIYAFNPNMETLLEELSRYLNDTDMAEAQQVVRDIEARIQKFRKANE